MAVDSLARTLFAIPGFRSRLSSVVVEDVARQFPVLTGEQHAQTPSRDWDYLLSCASVLAQSESGQCQDAAFRIAHSCITRPAADTAQRTAAALIFDTLSNAPALALAHQRGHVPQDALQRLPAPLALDRISRTIAYSIQDIGSQELVRLNRFQANGYRAIEDASWVSLSAPTSAGKSHLLQRVVEEFFLGGGLCAVYLVPTRALVQEVELRLGYAMRRCGLDRVRVSSVPSLGGPQDAAQLFVFTHVIARIARHLSGEFQALHWPHALLVVNWMRGLPLAVIIGKNWHYWKPRGKSLAAVIRETMKDIEEYARFRFAKYSFAYTDVLRLYLAKARPDLLDRVSDLNLLLEFGASQRTQLSLMDLGLSRATAIAVSGLIAADDLDVEQCRKWVADEDLDTLALSPIMIGELARVRDGLPQ